MTPAGSRACKLAAHQPATDQSEPYPFHSAASRAPRSSMRMGVAEVALGLADRLVDYIHAFLGCVQVHHNRGAHSQNVAGGNPGKTVAERFLVDECSRFHKWFLAGSVFHQFHAHQTTLAAHVP